MSNAREASASSHSHGHGQAHHASSTDPAVMAERLLRLKDSDPGLFSAAWKKIPRSTQDNILAYLRKHGGEEQVSSARHSNFEGKNSHSKHKRTGHAEPHHLDNVNHEKNLPHIPSLETRKNLQAPARPLYEWTDGELLAHTLLVSDVKDSPSEHGKVENDLPLEPRRMPKRTML